MQDGAIETDEVRTCTVTASLVAARLEDDDAIHLVIADPADPSLTMRVAFPDAAQSARIGDETLRMRMQASRESFVDTFGLPSFEGFVLLYGTARLTIAGVKRLDGSREDVSHVGARLYVLDFDATDADTPRPCACDQQPAPIYRSTAGTRVQEPWSRWATWS